MSIYGFLFKPLPEYFLIGYLTSAPISYLAGMHFGYLSEVALEWLDEEWRTFNEFKRELVFKGRQLAEKQWQDPRNEAKAMVEVTGLDQPGLSPISPQIKDFVKRFTLWSPELSAYIIVLAIRTSWISNFFSLHSKKTIFANFMTIFELMPIIDPVRADEMAEVMARVLCMVNNKKDAKDLYQFIGTTTSKDYRIRELVKDKLFGLNPKIAKIITKNGRRIRR